MHQKQMKSFVSQNSESTGADWIVLLFLVTFVLVTVLLLLHHDVLSEIVHCFIKKFQSQCYITTYFNLFIQLAVLFGETCIFLLLLLPVCSTYLWNDSWLHFRIPQKMWKLIWLEQFRCLQTLVCILTVLKQFFVVVLLCFIFCSQVTWDNLQWRFLVQHSLTTFLRHFFEWM